MNTKNHETISLEKAQDVVFKLSRQKLETEKEKNKSYSIAEFYKARCESQELTIQELRQKLAKAEHDRDRYKAKIIELQNIKRESENG